MIRVLAYRNKQIEELTAEQIHQVRPAELNEGEVVWIDMVAPANEETTSVLRNWFPVHELVISDCDRAITMSRDEQRFHHPKVDDFGNYLYVIMHALVAPGESVTDPATYLRETYEAQLNIIISSRVIITHHAAELPAVASLRQACVNNPEIMVHGPDYMLHLLLDDLVDGYLPLVEMIEDRVEELEHMVFRSTGNLTLVRILEIKRQLQKLRRDVVYQREIVNRLARGEFALISLEESMYYRNVYDHLVRIADQVDTCRELAMSIMEAYFSVSSAKLNQVMKVLTVLSTIFLPITFITSLYGMNFRYMPELAQTWGYPAVLLVIVATATTMFVIFRRRGWLA